MLRASDVFVLLYVVDVLLSLSFVLSCSLWSRTDGIVSPPAPLSAPPESQAAPCDFTFFLAYARVCVCDALARAPFSPSLLPSPFVDVVTRTRWRNVQAEETSKKIKTKTPREIARDVLARQIYRLLFPKPYPQGERGRGGSFWVCACVCVYARRRPCSSGSRPCTLWTPHVMRQRKTDERHPPPFLSLPSLPHKGKTFSLCFCFHVCVCSPPLSFFRGSEVCGRADTLDLQGWLITHIPTRNEKQQEEQQGWCSW